jgi:hypothetical protein
VHATGSGQGQAITEIPAEARETGDEQSIDEADGPVGTRERVMRALVENRDRVTATVALSALMLVVVATNLLWVRNHRRGLPFDIDEAGYLQRALRDGDALSHGGLSGLWDAFRIHDPQAPLLPITAGVLHDVTGVGPTGMIAGEQIFVIVAVVGAFLIARLLGAGLLAALIAAACVAALPGVVDGGRGFGFGVPAAAFMTATLAGQLAAGEFRRLRLAVVWGVFLGLATLTRTVMLALLPALVVAAIVRLLLTRAGLRQWANLVAGGLVALLVAGSWYSATWRPVWDYLTGYGYGSQAAGYGPGHSVLSWRWWTFRLENAAQNDVYLPLSLAGVVCLVVAASRLAHADRSWTRQPRQIATRFLSSGWGTLTIVLLIDYVVLSSTRNIGLHFELPLVPATAALLVSAASRSGRSGRLIALSVAAAAATFALVSANGLLPGGPESKPLTIGPFSMTEYDDRGPLLYYATLFVPGAASGSSSVLRQWERTDHLLADTLLAEGAQRGRPAPVVFFAVQNPFVNTNTLALRAQQRGISLPIGLLVSPKVAGESLAAQLVDARRGVPNVLILGQPSRNPRAAAFSPLQAKDMPAVRRAARTVGFERTSTLTMPDGRIMELWWRKGQT